MLSRIAESLFWLSRYIERAEYTARILDVNFHTLLEQSKDRYRLRWEPLIVMAGEEERFRQIYAEADARAVFEFLAFRQDNPSSIMQCIAKARENARTIRDFISREMWEDLNGLYFMVNRFNPTEEMDAGPHRFCDAIRFGSHRFHGVTDATLPHDEGWEFLRIGWFIERAEMTARLVDVQYHNLYDSPQGIGGAGNTQKNGSACRRPIPQLVRLARGDRRAGQPSMDGRAQVRRRPRGVPQEISFFHRAGKSGRNADHAPVASEVDPLQHDRGAVRVARYQRRGA